MLIGEIQADGSVLHRMDLLWVLAGALVGVQLLRSGLRYGMTSTLEMVSQDVLHTVRGRIYENLCK